MWCGDFRAEGQLATASVSGRVIDARAGWPIAGAVVDVATLYETVTTSGLVVTGKMDARRATRSGASPPRSVRTEIDGTFEFRGLLPGRYAIDARVPGYLHASFGRLRYYADGVPVVLAGGRHVQGLTIRAWKSPAIAGAVYDESGGAAIDVSVVALGQAPQGGRVRFDVAAVGHTDDRLGYRFPNLQPGRHLVAVPSTLVTVPTSVADALIVSDDAVLAKALTEAARSGAPVPRGDEPRFGGLTIDWRGLRRPLRPQ